MKKLIYIALLTCGVVYSSCQDELNTEPTTSISGNVLFQDVTNAQSAMEGVYRLLYTSGFAIAWESENCGHAGILLTADLMGEDHVMKAMGQGWFWYDYCLNVHSDYKNGKYGHPYAFWNFYYTIISNVNYILAYEETLPGDPDEVKNLMAQARAIRAFSYYYLIQIYQQTYIGHEDFPGVPVYTEPTVKGTPGKPRGTVEATYRQINEDIDKAIEYFKELGMPEHEHTSHVDYYIANGFKARICLTQHRYPEAAAAATEALKAPYARIATLKEMEGMNSVNNANVMWGMQVVTDQGSGYAGFFSHMDADAEGMYASTAQKCISSDLYNLLSPTDARLGWFRGQLSEDARIGSQTSYCQLKFQMADYSNRIGDIIHMRYEEMLLIKAEAECMQDLFGIARTTLKPLMENRDPEGYEDVLSGLSDAKTYSLNTSSAPRTLLEEILLQRRIELWGEAGRVFDLQRLGLGYQRGGNHPAALFAEPADDRFILPLPQTEIDGNENISAEDNNPIVI